MERKSAMTKCLDDFINHRKNDWLTRKLKEGKQDEQSIREEAEEKFSVKNWIEDASMRADQLHLVSHVAKLSHPEAKASAFIATCAQRNDGLIRSGNVKYENDVYGNAAALDVYQFLSLSLSDGSQVLDAFENNNPKLVEYILNLGLNFDLISANFLRIKKDISKPFTSHLIKQVYFPIAPNQYHLLSIVNPTGIMQELNNRIKKMRKESSDYWNKLKKDEIEEADFQRLTNLTKIGYGGSKPQNISSINNKEHGVFFLLPSLPPELSDGYLRIPTEDFFRQSLNCFHSAFLGEFKLLEKRWNAPISNIKSRQRIKNSIEQIVDQILFVASQYQALPGGWSQSLEKLPAYQKIWLDSALQDQRNTSEWKEKVIERVSAWIISSWEKTTQSHRFGDEQLKEFQRLIASEKEIF